MTHILHELFEDPLPSICVYLHIHNSITMYLIKHRLDYQNFLYPDLYVVLQDLCLGSLDVSNMTFRKKNVTIIEGNRQI